MTSERAGAFWILGAMIVGAGALVIGKSGLLLSGAVSFSCAVMLCASVFSLFWALGEGELRSSVPRGRALRAFLGHTFFSVIGILTMWQAVVEIDPAVVSFVSRSELIFSLLLAGVFLGDRFSSREWSGVAVTVAGVIVMKLALAGQADLALAGNRGFYLAIACAASCAASEGFSKIAAASLAPAAFTFYRNVLLAGAFAALLGALGKPLPVSAHFWVSAAASAALGPVAGRVLWFKGLRLLSLSKAAVLAQTHPLFTAFLAWVFLGTKMSRAEWAGAGLLTAGCLIVSSAKNGAEAAPG